MISPTAARIFVPLLSHTTAANSISFAEHTPLEGTGDKTMVRLAAFEIDNSNCLC